MGNICSVEKWIHSNLTSVSSAKLLWVLDSGVGEGPPGGFWQFAWYCIRVVESHCSVLHKERGIWSMELQSAVIEGHEQEILFWTIKSPYARILFELTQRTQRASPQNKEQRWKRKITTKKKIYAWDITEHERYTGRVKEDEWELERIVTKDVLLFWWSISMMVSIVTRYSSAWACLSVLIWLTSLAV